MLRTTCLAVMLAGGLCAISTCGGESELPTGSAGATSAGGSSAGGHAGSTSSVTTSTAGGASGAGGASSTGGSSGAGGAAGAAGASGAKDAGGGGAGGTAGGSNEGGPSDARVDSDAASTRDADATIPGPPGWGIHCGALLCNPSAEFCCLGATPSCLPKGSTACGNEVSLECDDRYDCCDETGCGRQACCANKNETGPVKGQCGVCTGERVQYLCDPKGIPDQCGGGPTHVPICAPAEDAGAPRLVPGYPYCVPT